MAITRPRYEDVAFYKDVHRLITRHMQGDRRAGDRSAYRCVQRIAPLIGEQVPPLADFYEVKCQDLSPGGFSFTCDTPPDYENYAVELGKSPVLIYVTARVVHVSELRQAQRVQFLAGCRFTGRLRE
ncbi:MAG TPA: PilZ domain-containing protein [Pirellulales bacterium]|nr:PilZ domain-containing protein [Pirellulales bacterium]